jgi:hypothetical protein
MRYSGILILIFFLNPVPGISQHKPDTGASEGNLYLNFRNINFFKNNEYQGNPIVEGYTLIGYFIQPELIYRLSDKISLNLGVHLLSYSGTNKFSLIKPVFSTTWHFSENTRFTFGTLNGSDGHRMFDPHFNSERTYNAYSEDGFQLTTTSDHFFNDFWLSWENYIFKGDTEREIFTVGESFRYESDFVTEFIKFEIPIQLQIKHYGGQISNYTGGSETYLNIASGARVSFDIAETRYGTAGFEYLFFSGSSIFGNAPSGVNNGYSGWYKLFYSLRIAEIETGFWSSHNFYAPNGNYIFGSFSDYQENLIISDRKIITGLLNIRLLYSNLLEFYAGFNGYYDTSLKHFDYAYSFHLRFDKLIKIASIRK